MTEGGEGRKLRTTTLTPGGKAMRKKFGGPLCRIHGASCKAAKVRGNKALKLTSRGLSCLGI